MDVKLIEIRDRATFIPAMAVRLFARDEEELYLLRRSGYAEVQVTDAGVEPYVVLCTLDGVEAHYDPFEWQNRRTMTTVHQHLIAHWNEVTSGDVVDVEYLLNEVREPKVSERVSS